MLTLDKLKREDIETLDAGPDIDALIAEIMGQKDVGWYAPYDSSGLHLHYKRYPTRQEAYEAYARYWDNWLKEGNTVEDVHLCSWRDGWGPIFVDEYSEDLYAAAEATDWMAQKTGWMWLVGFSGHHYSFIWSKGLSMRVYVDKAPTEELARCRAVLLAGLLLNKIENLEYEQYLEEIGDMPKILEMTEEETEEFKKGFKEGFNPRK